MGSVRVPHNCLILTNPESVHRNGLAEPVLKKREDALHTCIRQVW
jgi:hypothetical protein